MPIIPLLDIHHVKNKTTSLYVQCKTFEMLHVETVVFVQSIDRFGELSGTVYVWGPLPVSLCVCLCVCVCVCV